MSTLCLTDTLDVKIDVLNVNAGPDITICLNEDIKITAGSDFSNIIYPVSYTHLDVYKRQIPIEYELL